MLSITDVALIMGGGFARELAGGFAFNASGLKPGGGRGTDLKHN